MKEDKKGDASEKLPSVSKLVDQILLHRPDLSREKIFRMIEERIKELEGLIDEDAAALLVAKELGVPLPLLSISPHTKSRILLKDLIAGLQNVQIVACVLKVVSWKLPDGKTMTKLLLADESACIEGVAWGETAEKIADWLKPGDCILLTRASVVKYKGRLEVKINDDSVIERVREQTFPPLDELLKRYSVNAFKLQVHQTVVGKDGVVVYGASDEGASCILIPKDIGVYIPQQGDIIFIQDPKPYGRDIRRFILTKSSKIFKIGNTSIDISSFKIVDLDKETISQTSIGLRGRYVATIPSKRGGFLILLSGGNGTASILTFNENVVNDLKQLKPASTVELMGLYATGHGLRLNPFYHLRPINHNHHSQRYFSEILSVVEGYVKIRATIISAVFRFKMLSSGEPIIGILMNVDDGTDWARAITSYEEAVQQLLRTSWEEIRELASSGILPELLAYMEEELRGSDIEVQGYLAKDRVLAIEAATLVG